MDTRRLLIILLIAGGLFLAGKAFFPGLFGGNANVAAPIIANPLYDNPAALPAASEQGALPQTISLGTATKPSTDKVAIVVDNVTAGIDLVQLNVSDYAQDVKSPEHPIPEPLTLLKAVPGTPKPYSTLGVHVFLDGATEEKIIDPTVTTDAELQKVASDVAAQKRAESPADLKTDLDRARAARIASDNSTIIYKKQYVWKVLSKDAHKVTLLLTMPGIAEITKTFSIDPASYEVSISHEVKNLSGKPLRIAIDQMAATDLPRDNIQTDDRFYHAAVLDTDKRIVDAARFNATHVEMQKLSAPEKEPWKIGTKDIGQLLDFSGTSKDAATKDPILWIAASNRFFVAITRPLALPTDPVYTLSDGAKRTIAEPGDIASASIDVLYRDNDDATKTVAGVRLNGASINLPANATTSLPLSVYFGPKKRDILAGNAGAPTGSPPYNYDLFQYNSVIQLSSGSCFLYTFCTFDWLAKIILWLLGVIVTLMPWQNYGIAIMVLVILVRALLHPLTRASQVNMAVMGKKMRAVAPKLEAAKKRFAKEPKKLQEEQMKIYRENDVNPAGGLLGCLPMFIQMPIWIALFNSLRTDIDLRHAMFIPGWINDLSNPDAIVNFHPFNVPMLGAVSSFNLLPILLGVVFFLQMKVQTASQPAASDPSQAKMQKISSYMILLFPLFLYNAPSGLNVYMFASTLGGLVDTYFVRKTLRRKGILPVTASNLPTQEIMEPEEFNKP